MPTPNRIYLDNAATTVHKPDAVRADIVRFFDEHYASSGRGAYREAQQTARLQRSCRQSFCNLINGQSPDHCIFTLNCSDALNLAIRGLLRPGDHVVTSAMDHNSVLRPLQALRQRIGLQITHLPVDPHTTLLDPAALRNALRPDTRLVAIVHASNVTGVLQPIAQIGQICRKAGVPMLVDAAQSAGHVPIDVQAMGVDLLAVPGHKGLLGCTGTGLLYIRPGLEEHLQTVREGGTGSASEHDHQPDTMPDKYEAGSHNALGIAGLHAGIEWVLSQSVEHIHRQQTALADRFLDAVRGQPGLHVFGPPTGRDRVAVFSVRVDGYAPAELSAALESSFGILSRSGLHCAPLAHRTIGTLEIGGTTRLSCSALTTPAEIDLAAAALVELAHEARRSPAAVLPAARR